MKLAIGLFKKVIELHLGQILKYIFVFLVFLLYSQNSFAQCLGPKESSGLVFIQSQMSYCQSGSVTTNTSPNAPIPVQTTFSGGLLNVGCFSPSNCTTTYVISNNVNTLYCNSMSTSQTATITFSQPVMNVDFGVTTGPGQPITASGGGDTFEATSGDNAVGFIPFFFTKPLTSITITAGINNTGTYGFYLSDVVFNVVVPSSPTLGTIIASPSSGSSGTPINITGSGWSVTPGGSYQLLFDGNLVAQQSIATCSDQPNLSFDVPCGARTNSSHTITCNQGTLSKSISFSVISPTIAGNKTAYITNCTSIRVDALEVSMPITPNPTIKGKEPPPQTFTTKNNSIQFATADSEDLMVIFQATTTGLPEITAKGVPSSDAHLLRWELKRDPTDNIPNDVPQIPNLNKNQGSQIQITPNTPGNFILICYADDNKNNTFDPGEQLKVLRFAIIRATIKGTPLIYTGDITAREGISDCGEVGQDCIKTLEPSMLFNMECLLEGGGQDRRIGLEKVDFGHLQNLVMDDSQTNYPVPTPVPPPPGNLIGIGTENPGGPIPMIDTGALDFNKEATGGKTPFDFYASVKLVDNPGGPGKILQVNADDPPGFGPWKRIHPSTNNPWQTTQGGFKFKSNVVGYTTNFDKYYVVIASATWTVTGVGHKDSSSSLWINDTSEITVQDKPPSVTSAPMTINCLNGSPLPGKDANLQTLGLSFTQQHKFEYSTSKK